MGASRVGFTIECAGQKHSNTILHHARQHQEGVQSHLSASGSIAMMHPSFSRWCGGCADQQTDAIVKIGMPWLGGMESWLAISMCTCCNSAGITLTSTKAFCLNEATFSPDSLSMVLSIGIQSHTSGHSISDALFHPESAHSPVSFIRETTKPS